ncbi:hypothetical protein PTKIN_Ptkin04bG0110900 [Pterospermum kingtungense]
MADEIEAMWNNLSIMEDNEEEVVISSSWIEEGVNAVQNCLLGKMVINKPYCIEDAIEKDRVLVKQSWAFNKSLIVLQEYDGLRPVEEVQLDYFPFWVQIHGLPIGLISEKIAIVIGESLGDVEEVDVKGDNCV